MNRLFPLIWFLLGMPYFAAAQLFEIKEGGKWGLMDSIGTVVLQPQFDYLYPSSDDQYFFTFLQAKTGLYHIEHGEIVPPSYDQLFIHQNSSGDLSIVIEGKYGILNPQQNKKILPEYDEIKTLREGVYAVRKGKRWGVESLSGEVRIPESYVRLISFEEDGKVFFCAYDQNKNSHIWDAGGQSTIQNIPYLIHDYVSGVFIYRQRRQLGILGNSQEPLTEAQYSRIDPLGTLFRVQTGGKYGLLTPQGEIRLNAKYDEIRIDTSGHFWIRTGKWWGFTNEQGQLVVDSSFSQAGSFEGPVSRVRVGRSFGVINEAGQYVVDPQFRVVRIYPGLARYFRIEDSTWAQARFDDQGTPIRQRKLIVAQSSGAYKFMRTRSMQKEENLRKAFGWFTSKNRWGLRDTISGKLRINPKFDSVAVHPQYNLSTVGIKTYSPQQARFGIVNHNSSRLEVSPVYKKIYIEDLAQSSILRGYSGGGTFQLLDPTFSMSREMARISRPLYSYIGAPRDSAFRVRFKRKNTKPIDPDHPALEQQLIKMPEIWEVIKSDGSYTNNHFTYISPIVNQVFRYRSGKMQKMKWGLYHLEDGNLLEPTYAFIDDPAPEAAFLISGMSGTKYSFLDREGTFLFEKMADSLSQDNRKTVVRRVGNFNEGLIRTQINRFWGYLNEKGDLVIPPQFRAAGDFTEGFASVKDKGGWGFINTEGEWLGKQKSNGKRKIYYFDNLQPFQEGYAAVKKGSRWGYINTSGRLQIRSKFSRVFPFDHGMAIVKTSKFGLIDQEGKWVLKPKYDKIIPIAGGYDVALDGKHGFFSYEREWVMDLHFQKIQSLQEDKIVFKQDNRYGVMDEEGNILMDPTYKFLRDFSENRAAVLDSGKWGFINEDGKQVIPHVYARAESFQNGVARVQGGRPRKWGVINAAGDTLLPLIYERIKHLPGGWLSCRVRDPESNRAKWIYMDTYGVPSHQQDYDSARSVRGTELAILGRKGKEYVIDVDSRPITNPGYDRILAVGKDVIVGESRGLVGLIDRKGKEVFPPQFEAITYRKGLYQVHLNGQVGYLNNQGKWIRSLRE
ncbi:MAG: WG repeat-containing protein [Bacteroidota bacterium]